MAYERRLSSASDSSTSTAQSTESTNANEKISSLSSYKRQLIHHHQRHHYTTAFTTNDSIIKVEQKQPSNKSLTTSTSLKRNTSLLASPAEQLLARTKNTFVDLNPYFECSSLPNHWRKNKSLRFILKPKPNIDIKSNTRVMILAGNEFNPCASLKNNISWFRNGQAEFNDLRFLGASGRGKKFTLAIFVDTNPPQQCTYRRAIKITVDGPRKKRELKHKADSNSIQEKEDEDSDGDSEHERIDMQMKTRSISQASSGLMILAAAAEQKRQEVLNEEDDKDYHSSSISTPMDICPSNSTTGYQYQSGSVDTSCSSPSSSLSSVFATSIMFSDFERMNSPIMNKTMKNSFLNNNNNTTVYPVMSNVTNMNGIDRFKIQNESSSTITTPITSQLTSTTNLIHPVFTFSSKLLPPTATEYYHTPDNPVTTVFEPSSTSHVLCR
ncbi:unnamed protein product [Didymodactylos carnosus]|uniref:Runt domain-containing protein n=1 Tax=Didymodactylos carnosus TaxID=1234261 RepID=A0A813T1H7_9BILA|nr:unnamed protein product [Didymodactylos carnosus]CAF0807606.1 unnamed protein product [Didymodactylos carnosus]CAF3535426.1 unnamed protein product [Didymodactylos carnosus]CAF3593118.1 unnamed protein product [Didymodactylos carnosus]